MKGANLDRISNGLAVRWLECNRFGGWVIKKPGGQTGLFKLPYRVLARLRDHGKPTPPVDLAL